MLGHDEGCHGNDLNMDDHAADDNNNVPQDLLQVDDSQEAVSPAKVHFTFA